MKARTRAAGGYLAILWHRDGQLTRRIVPQWRVVIVHHAPAPSRPPWEVRATDTFRYQTFRFVGRLAHSVDIGHYQEVVP
jgi:hypothetical protein